ncbi:MAG: I78 family peptidase inhibitor [Croceibacterium sp.]
MKITAVASLAGLVLLSACATTAPPPPAPIGSDADAVQCDAAPAQSHIGHKASVASGTELMRITHARTLRWVPPRTAVTMDFRADRLTVSYDDNMVIERISCG